MWVTQNSTSPFHVEKAARTAQHQKHTGGLSQTSDETGVNESTKQKSNQQGKGDDNHPT